jgi:hypothetical protein
MVGRVVKTGGPELANSSRTGYEGAALAASTRRRRPATIRSRRPAGF